MLALDMCCKTYRMGAFGRGELHAVRNVSFEVGQGEVVSLIGESGSGKSTIGKMILRLLRVTRGAIHFDGTDISSLDGKSLRAYYGEVQGVFQDPFSSYNPIFKVGPGLHAAARRALLGPERLRVEHEGAEGARRRESEPG